MKFGTRYMNKNLLSFWKFILDCTSVFFDGMFGVYTVKEHKIDVIGTMGMLLFDIVLFIMLFCVVKKLDLKNIVVWPITLFVCFIIEFIYLAVVYLVFVK